MKFDFLVGQIRTVIRSDHFDVFQFAEKEAVSRGSNGSATEPTAMIFSGTFKRVSYISGQCSYTRWLWSSTPPRFGHCKVVYQILISRAAVGSMDLPPLSGSALILCYDAKYLDLSPAYGSIVVRCYEA